MSFHKTLDSALESLMPTMRRVERFLGPEDDWVEDDRRALFEAAQSRLGSLHTFVREKYRNEYVTTVHASPDAVEKALVENGPYQRNLTSSRKYRTDHDGGKQWAVGSYVEDGLGGDEYIEQHHVYLFEGPDGQTDVYAHRETSVLEGAEHITDTQQKDADPHVLFDVFDRSGFEYGERSFEGQK